MVIDNLATPWWRYQMETFSALLACCAGNSPVTGEFPSQRPVTRISDVFFDLCLNKRLTKQSRRRWFGIEGFIPEYSRYGHSGVKIDWLNMIYAAWGQLLLSKVEEKYAFKGNQISLHPTYPTLNHKNRAIFFKTCFQFLALFIKNVICLYF